jgi:hypothetical protein
MVASPWILLKMKNISDKSCRENHCTRSVLRDWFSENRIVYKVMWKCKVWERALMLRIRTPPLWFNLLKLKLPYIQRSLALTREEVFVKRNNEARSRNCCCCGKAIGITHFCVRACVRLRACNHTNPSCNAPPYCLVQLLWLCQIFRHYLINGTIF